MTPTTIHALADGYITAMRLYVKAAIGSLVPRLDKQYQRLSAAEKRIDALERKLAALGK